MNKRKKIVILGGGTSGWICAAILSRGLAEGADISVIESKKLGTIGVGEATIPHIVDLNRWLGLDENEVIKKASATFKLGIRFKGWGRINSEYTHGFDILKGDVDYYRLLAHLNNSASAMSNEFNIDELSLAATTAKESRFTHPDRRQYAYAYHIDASKYTELLKSLCLKQNVNIIDAHVNEVQVESGSGNIKSLLLDNGSKIYGETFVDCSGFAKQMIHGTYNARYKDWSNWLLMNSAIAFPSNRNSDQIPSYTLSTATKHGWNWTIPLQHRNGNGRVFNSDMVSDEDNDKLQAEAEANNAKQFKFISGCNEKNWIKNCVAIGLSSGFLEPLESTSIYLIQISALKLLQHLKKPTKNSAEIFNKEMLSEYERVRDFIILHYAANNRNDSQLWKHCRTMELPDSLESHIETYKQLGRAPDFQSGLFRSPSWHCVFIGQKLLTQLQQPDSLMIEQQKLHYFERVKAVSKIASKIPLQRDYIQKILTK